MKQLLMKPEFIKKMNLYSIHKREMQFTNYSYDGSSIPDVSGAIFGE
jgi:hypothetical protein